MKIHYKKWSNWWFCYATINGIDVSKKHDTEEMAKRLMEQYVNGIGKDTSKIEWIFDGEFDPDPPKIDFPKIGIYSHGLDYL